MLEVHASNVTNVERMFKCATAFSQDTGSWNVSNVTNMTCMLEEQGCDAEDIRKDMDI